jgi:predicted DNA-binding protein
MKRINIGLKDELHAKAKILAVLKNRTLSSLIEDALDRYIDENKELNSLNDLYFKNNSTKKTKSSKNKKSTKFNKKGKFNLFSIFVFIMIFLSLMFVVPFALGDIDMNVNVYHPNSNIFVDDINAFDFIIGADDAFEGDVDISSIMNVNPSSITISEKDFMECFNFGISGSNECLLLTPNVDYSSLGSYDVTYTINGEYDNDTMINITEAIITNSVDVIDHLSINIISPESLTNNNLLNVETNRNADCGYQVTSPYTTQIAALSGTELVHTVNMNLTIGGDYTIYVLCNDTKDIKSVDYSFEYDTTKSNIITQTPTGNVFSPSLITIETDDLATCYVELNNQNVSMNSSNNIAHQYNMDLPSGSYNYNVYCFDDANNVDETIVSFDVIENADVSLSFDKTQPFSDGSLEITLTTSKILTFSMLEYQYYGSSSFNELQLIKQDDYHYKAYLDIADSNDEKVGIFKFSGTDEDGLTIDGITPSTFNTDTMEPLKISSIAIIKQNEDGYNTNITWVLEDDNLKEIRIYKLNNSNVSLVNYYKIIDFNDGVVHSILDNNTNGTIYYKILAVDNSNNVGPLSELFSISFNIYNNDNSNNNGGTNNDDSNTQTSSTQSSTTNANTNTPVKITEEEKEELNEDSLEKITKTIEEIEDILVDLDWYNGNIETTEVYTELLIIKDLKLKTKINENVEILKNYKKEVDSLKKLTDDKEVAKRINVIKLKMNKVKSETPITLSLLGEKQDIQTYNIQTATKSLEYFLAKFKLEQNARDNEIENNLKLQDGLNIKTYIKVFTVEYLDESEKTFSLIRKEVAYDSLMEGISLIEYVPKTIAETVNDMNIVTENHIVLQEDPVVKWDYESIDFETKEIKYIVNKKVSLDQLRESYTTIAQKPEDNSGENKVTGNFISSVGDGLKKLKDNLIYLLGFIMLLGLSGYYVFLKYYDKTDIDGFLSDELKLDNKLSTNQSNDGLLSNLNVSNDSKIMPQLNAGMSGSMVFENLNESHGSTKSKVNLSKIRYVPDVCSTTNPIFFTSPF